MNLGHNPQFNQDSNPLIDLPNPYKELQSSVEELAKMHPVLFEDDQLCYEVFIKNEFGVRLMKKWEETILMGGISDPSHPQAPQIALHAAAIKTFIIKIKTHANNHRMRIEAT